MISYGESSASASSSRETLIEDDSESVHNTLYLLDIFGVSDKFYHELSMIYPCLQRSYKVKGARTTLNCNVDLIKLPSNKGCYRPQKESICSAIKAEI